MNCFDWYVINRVENIYTLDLVSHSTGTGVVLCVDLLEILTCLDDFSVDIGFSLDAIDCGDLPTSLFTANSDLLLTLLTDLAAAIATTTDLDALLTVLAATVSTAVTNALPVIEFLVSLGLNAFISVTCNWT